MPATHRIYNSSLLFFKGLILVVFSFYIFIHPGDLLDNLEFVAGLVAICTSPVYFAGYFSGEYRGRIFPDFFTAVVLLGMGFMLLNGNGTAREWLKLVMAALLVLLALNVFLAALEMKYAFKWWWLSVVTGVSSLFIAFLVISRNHFAGMPVSVLIALHLLSLGLLMIWLSIIDRRIEREYRKTLKELRETGGR